MEGLEGLSAEESDAVKAEIDRRVDEEVANRLDDWLAADERHAAQLVEDFTDQLHSAQNVLARVKKELDAVIGPRRWDESIPVHDLRRAVDDLEDLLSEIQTDLPVPF